VVKLGGCWVGIVAIDAYIQRTIMIGKTLSGRYRIERELGEGGMGVIYLATDGQVAGETFAIKVLKDTLNPEALELLREEAHKTRRLSHPNIVNVHSLNVDGTKLYVLMEHLEGKSLNALLDEEFGRGMPLSRAWPIIEGAAGFRDCSSLARSAAAQAVGTARAHTWLCELRDAGGHGSGSTRRRLFVRLRYLRDALWQASVRSSHRVGGPCNRCSGVASRGVVAGTECRAQQSAGVWP
jgi:Protein kinase domain